MVNLPWAASRVGSGFGQRVRTCPHELKRSPHLLATHKVRFAGLRCFGDIRGASIRRRQRASADARNACVADSHLGMRRR